MWSHLNVESEKAKLIKTESKMMVTRGLGGRKEMLVKG